MSILVTGGAGFIGSHVSEKLISRGNKVVCLDNFDPYYDLSVKEKNILLLKNNPNFILYRKDILDSDIKEIIEKENITKIIHLAAKVGVRNSIINPLEYVDTNIKGTTNLLNIAAETGIKKFIFASSSSVYGDSKKKIFGEGDICLPISPYGATKKCCETMCNAFHDIYGLKVACLRFFTVYGPGGRPDMAPYKFTDLISKRTEIPVYGGGSSIRDYTYVSDIVDGIMLALEKEIDFEIINLGCSKAVKLMEIIKVIEENLGMKAKIKYLPVQQGDMQRTLADISKARKTLGYEPKVNIKDGLREFISWFKSRKH